MAEPSEVLTSREKPPFTPLFRVAVTVINPPSSSPLTLEIVTAAESSFIKLLMPTLSNASSALILGLLRVTEIASSGSTVVSPLVVTSMVWLSTVVPAANVNVSKSVSSFPPLIK